jgi:hypothetical protein
VPRFARLGAHRVQRQFPGHEIHLIATPYCEEAQIARVARSYGAKVSDAEVRKNPLTKVYLCQVYGYDTRLKGSCGAYSPEHYR